MEEMDPFDPMEPERAARGPAVPAWVVNGTIPGSAASTPRNESDETRKADDE
jgi:hypothetical protein